MSAIAHVVIVLATYLPTFGVGPGVIIIVVVIVIIVVITRCTTAHVRAPFATAVLR